MTSSSMTLEDIATRVRMLVQRHGWDDVGSDKPQTPRNVAISIALEAAELLKCFQWSDHADATLVGDELADIVIFVTHLANTMKIDLDSVIERKVAFNDRRTWPGYSDDRK